MPGGQVHALTWRLLSGETLTPSQLQATQGRASLPPETSHFGFGLGHLQRAANRVEEETGGRVPTCQAVASPCPLKVLQQSQEARSAALNRWGNCSQERESSLPKVKQPASGRAQRPELRSTRFQNPSPGALREGPPLSPGSLLCRTGTYCCE